MIIYPAIVASTLAPGIAVLYNIQSLVDLDQIMVAFFKQISDSKFFHNVILVVIVLAGIVVGMETYPRVVEKYGSLLHWLHRAILIVFVVELVIRLGAFGSQFWRFFRDPWNVFDFIIVAMSFLPMNTQFAAVLRLARVLRVMRLVTALPRLQILVGALLKSIPSMGYVALLLLLHFYVYAVIGTYLFGKNDPLHFGTLAISMLSLFQVVTLEGWVDLMYIQMHGAANFGYDGKEHLIVQSTAQPLVSVMFFVSFILLGTMIILNLLIGVIMKGMEEMHTEAEIALRTRLGHETGRQAISDELAELDTQLDQMKKNLEVIRHRVKFELKQSEDRPS